MNKRNTLLYMTLSILVTATIFSCQRTIDKPSDDNNNNPKLDTANSTWADRLYDSVYLYAREIYYWYDQLPAYENFLPRQYKTNDTLAGLEEELFQITRYPKDGAGNLYEQAYGYDDHGKLVKVNTFAKYSYIMRTADARNGGAVSQIVVNEDFTRKLKMTLDGKENDFGFRMAFMPAEFTYGTPDSIDAEKTDPKENVAFVRYVTKGSPAYHAGLRRGMYITKINNVSATFDNVNSIEAAFKSGSMKVTTYKPSTKKEKTFNLKKQLYSFDPFIKDTVITQTSSNKGVTKKIGYAAYKSFTDYDSSSKAPMQKVINRFVAAGVQDIVIDLRFNGGGSVETAEKFINYLAPSSANGQVMMVTYYNTLLQTKKATILKNLPQRDNDDKPIPGKSYFDYNYSEQGNTYPIKKASALSLPRIYFIVSSSSASASELVINSLRPYMDVTLIGAAFSDDGKRTYGKPVGFFEVIIGPEKKSFSMWISNFETKNANGDGNYYAGMETDAQAFDDIRYDLGNPQERSFRQAIRYILGDMQYTPPVSAARFGGAVKATAREQNSMFGARGITVGEITTIHDMVVEPRK